MATVTTSKQFTLNVKDILRGLLMAVILPVLAIVQESISSGSLTFDWKRIGLVAAGAFIAYLIKNFFTPAQIVITDPHPATVEQVQQGKATVTVTPTS